MSANVRLSVRLSVCLSVWPCGGVLVESSVGTQVTCRTKVTCRTDATSHRVRMRRFNLKHQEKQEKKMCDNFFQTRNSDRLSFLIKTPLMTSCPYLSFVFVVL